MLKTALKTQSPKVVILETNTLFRYRGIVKGAKASLSASFKYYFPLFRYHNGWKLPFLEEAASEEEYKGFPIRSTVRSYDGGKYMNKTKDKEEISTFVQIYMDKILEICKKEGIELILVSAPSPKNYNYKRHNAIVDYAKEKGITYLNLNLKQDELQMNWQTDSLDKGDHLNVSGAHKVTEYLGNYLKEHYDLKDHRTQETYQDWNMEAIEYNEKVKETLNGNKVSFHMFSFA